MKAFPIQEGDPNASALRERWKQRQSPASREWLERDENRFVHQSLSTPCLDVIERAQGSAFYTLDGKRVLDFHGNNVHQVGYRHPHVVEAVVEALNTLPFSPRRYTNRQVVLLSERLAAISPIRDTRVLLARGGSEAAGMAMKLARVATGKYKTLSMYGAFHGAAMDSLSLGYQPEFVSGLGPLLPGAIHAFAHEPRRCVFGCGGVCHEGCLDYIERVLDIERDVGLLLVETVRNTDVQAPPASYYSRLGEICRRHGVLLAVDETAVAWCRTGKMFAIEHYGLEPDMVIIGKGLGAGVYPIGGLLVRGDLNEAAGASVGHFTFEKSPVGAAAANAMLDVLESEQLCRRSVVLGERLDQAFRRDSLNLPSVGEVRHLGLLFAVDIVHPRTKSPCPELAERTLYRSLAKGLNFKLSNGCTASLTPALTICEDEWMEAYDIFVASLSEACEEMDDGSATER